MVQIERTVEIDAPIERVFAFITDVRNHPQVVPPETREQLLDGGDEPLKLSSRVKFRARSGGVTWTLLSSITAFDPPNKEHSDSAYFRDEQVKGPFAEWRHDHWFASTSAGSTNLTDRFTFTAPYGPLGRVAERLWLTNRMTYLMEYMQTAQKRMIEAGSL